jgi:hypothetical protein
VNSSPSPFLFQSSDRNYLFSFLFSILNNRRIKRRPENSFSLLK